MPEDDASSVPNDGGNEDFGNVPMDGGQPPMDGGMEDPMGGPQDGGMPDDMGADQPPMDDGMNSEPSEMDGGMPEGGEGTGDSTIDIINQLSPTDKEAVRSYAESMLNRDETSGQEGQEMPPMSESFIFTKKQFSKINENLINMDDKNKKRDLVGANKPNKKVSQKSPFGSPKFN